MSASSWSSPQRLVALFLLLGTCTQSVSSLNAAVISGYDPAIHDRYFNGTPNPNFIIDESDISGISGSPDTSLNRAMLISPLHIITARHTGVPTVRYRTSDGTFKSYSVDNSPGGFVDLTTDLGGGMTSVSDIRIYRLSEPIPISDGVIPIPIFEGTASDLVGQEFFSMGQNNQSGRNVIRDVVLTEVTGANPSITYTTAYTYDTDPSHPLYDGVGVGETRLIGGDSGQATLLQIGDDVALLGTNLAITTASPDYGGLFTNFSSLLSPYLPEIRSIVEADGFSISTLSVVPEPSSFAVLAIAVIGCYGRRRRR